MILIACVDDGMGMAFNHRRQSRDKVLCERIQKLTVGGRLWMNHYSEALFADAGAPQINIDDNFLNEAAQGDYCFVEDCSVLPYEKWAEKIILYKWNRKYPSDIKFDISLVSDWKLTSASDFIGSSHDKITEEVYVK